MSLIKNLIWIDSNLDTNENKRILETLSSKLNVIKCNNIKQAFNHILKIQYQTVFVVISGKFYNDYIKELNINIDKIICIPISIIFTTQNMENFFLGKEKLNFPLSEETKKSINHPFYNPGGIAVIEKPLFYFIEKYTLNFPILNKNLKKKKENYNNNFFIENNIDTNNLILPSLINKLINKEKYNEKHNEININDVIYNLKIFLKDHSYDDENVYELFLPLIEIEKIPFKIIIKFFFKAFFYQTKFYKNICDNNNNNNSNKNLQSIFYNLIYKGLELNCLKTDFSKNLYKIIKIPLKLYQQYENEFNNNIKNDKISEYDKIYGFIYFDKFIPFYGNLNYVLSFFNEEENKNDNENVYVLLEIEKFSNKNQLTLNFGSSLFSLDNKYFLFPFNILIIKNIKIEKFGLKDFSIKKFELNILDNYQSNLRLFNFDEKFKKNLFSFQFTKNILNNEFINSFNNKTNEEIFFKIIDSYNNNNYNIKNNNNYNMNYNMNINNHYNMNINNHNYNNNNNNNNHN